MSVNTTDPLSADNLEKLAPGWFPQTCALQPGHQAAFESWQRDYRKWLSGNGMDGLLSVPERDGA